MRAAILIIGCGAQLALASASAAEMRVELHDGRAFVLPVGRDEVKSVTFDDGTALTLPEPEVAAPAPEAAQGRGRVLKVGKGQAYARPSQAAAAARDGDMVEIEAGSYAGDVASWPQSALVIRGVGGPVLIDARGRASEDKGVWVVKGERVLIENVELSGSRSPDHNGAGIRAEGGRLTLRGVSIHGNEMGVLSAHEFKGELRIERSAIFDNTVDYEATGSLGHNLYIGGADRFVLIGSWVHGAVDGHNVKSRANENRILYNLIEDGEGGAASYQIDIADAAPTLILGNLIRQGSHPGNNAVISIASEGGQERGNLIVALASNTVESRHPGAVLVRNQGASPLRLLNTAMVGISRQGEGRIKATGNRSVSEADFAAPDALDFHPRRGSALLDAGVDGGKALGLSLQPSQAYAHPNGLTPRRNAGRGLDIGAFEAAD